MAIRYALIPADGVVLPPTSQMSGITVGKPAPATIATPQQGAGRCGVKSDGAGGWVTDTNYYNQDFMAKTVVLVGKVNSTYDRMHAVYFKIGEYPANGDPFKYWVGLDVEGNEKDALTAEDVCFEDVDGDSTFESYFKVKYDDEAPA